MEKFRKNRKKIGVYSILCTVNMKMYIGSTKYIAKRWANHRDSFRRGTNLGNIQADYDKYGERAFTYSILEDCEQMTELEMLEREEDWVRRYNTTNIEYGYNIQLPTLGSMDKEGSNRNIKRGRAIYKLVDDTPVPIDRRKYSEQEMNYIRSVCYYWENAQGYMTNTKGMRNYKGAVYVWAHCYTTDFDYKSYVKPRKVRSKKEKIVKVPIPMTERNLGRKQIEAINKETGEVTVYRSAIEAANMLGIKGQKISDTVYGNRKSYKGYTFRYTGACDRDTTYY